jgi:hypothetical protein
MEIWKDINNYEGYYQISNYGNVRSLIRRHGLKTGNTRETPRVLLLSPTPNSRGYKVVQLMSGKNGYRSFTVHHLVATHFLIKPDLPGYININHKDACKTNNNVENLEWVTHKQNIRHAVEMGLFNNRCTGRRPGFKRHPNAGRKPIDIKSSRSLEILKYRGIGLGKRKVGKMFKCSDSTVSKIWNEAL